MENVITISARELKIILQYRTKPIVKVSLCVLMVARYQIPVHQANGSIITSTNATTVQVHANLILNVLQMAFISSRTTTTATNSSCALLGIELTFSDPSIYFVQYKNQFRRFPIVMNCADGLYFDRELGQCNFPEYAECEYEVCPPENDPKNITFIPSDVYCDK